MKQLHCDNDLCESTVSVTDVDNRMDWLLVGWLESDQHDACSIDCAHAILDTLQHQRWEIEAIIEAEAAKVGHDEQGTR